MPIYSQYEVPKDIINLGVGQPATSELPLEWFKSTLQDLSSTLDNPEFLQYGAISGYDSVKNELAKWLTNKYYANIKKKLNISHSISKEQLFMTNGNTGALQLLIDTYVETSDEIIIEDPTYFIAKNIFEDYGLNVNYVPIEKDGINIEILEEKILEIIEADTKQLQNRIFLYIIPIHHNPTSITLSHSKRLELAKLCDKYPKFYIIADEVYHFLNFENNDLHYPLADYHEKIISLGSFSKLLSPSLRVGYMYQKESTLLEGIKKSAILDSSGGINPLGFKLIETAITNGSLDKIINKNILMLKEKSNFVIEFLKQNDINFIIPKGGYFIWIDLNIDTNAFLNFATSYKVKFQPGVKFGQSCNNFLRISFSYYNSDDLITGVSRIIEAYSIFIKTKIYISGLEIKESLEKDKSIHIIDSLSSNIDAIIDNSSDENTCQLIKNLLDLKLNKPIIIASKDLTPKTLDYIRIYSMYNPVLIVSDVTFNINKLIDEEWKRTEKDSEIKFENNNGEIIYYKKIKNIFAINCVNYINKIIKKNPGLYYNLDNSNNFKMCTSLGNKFLISTKNYLSYFMKEDKECDYFILVKINDLNYNWIIFNKKGIVEKSNGNDLMAVAKYLHTENNIKYGEILDNKYIFKYENNKYYFQMEEPKEYTLKDEYTQNLKQLIEQLTGLNVVGMSKYIMVSKHLIIEIKDDLFNFDTDIIKTICSIINSEGNNSYNISFINLLDNNLIRVKYYDCEKLIETDGNAYSCLAIFDYYAYVNEISYDNNFEVNLLLNKDNIKIIYKDNKYFISY